MASSGGNEGGSASSASAVDAAAAATFFPDDMDEADVNRLQAVLEARGFPPHLAGMLGPHMHHLILNRALAPSATSKAHQLLTGLQAVGDESRQLQAVIEMCQLLVMGNEDTLTGFPVRQVVPALIVLLRMEHNFDLMNHACRALTYMMEALPRSASVIVEAIPPFLEKLQVIACMDVAEQSLTALEMLSKKHAKAILHAKGVAAVLTYLDFFSISAQRNALAITANCCQGLLPEEFVHLQDCLTTLSSRLVHDDKKSSESACLALSRLAESFKNDKNRLRDLAKPELLDNLLQIIAEGNKASGSSGSNFVTVLHILVLMTTNSSNVGLMLLEKDISKLLHCLLLKPSSLKLSSDLELSPRNPHELYELTWLITELMPPLSADGIFAVDSLLAKPGSVVRDPVYWQWQDDKNEWHTYGYNDCRYIEASFVAGEEEVVLNKGLSSHSSTVTSIKLNLRSMHEIREESGTARPIQRKLASQLNSEVISAERQVEMSKHLELTAELTTKLLSVLLEVYATTAGPGVRHSCLSAFIKMVYHCDQNLLRTVLKSAAVSSLIAGMLSSGDLKIIVGALQLSELLLQKMPTEYGVFFRREGVLHQVQRLADPDNPIVCIQSQPQPSTLSHSGWSTSALASRSERSSTFSYASSSNLASMMKSSGHSGSRRSVGGGEEFNNSEANSNQTPLRLSDMLKRKRSSKHGSQRKGNQHRNSLTSDDNPQDLSNQVLNEPSPGSSTTTPGMQPSTSYGSNSAPNASSSTRRSRLADRTSSLLSQLHPSRWVKNSGFPSGSSSDSSHRKDSSPSMLQSIKQSALGLNSSNVSALSALSREKAKKWVREQASRVLEAYFKESLGSRHPALTILRRLSAHVDHLIRKPKDGERSLREILTMLSENDISPFEVTQSGLVSSLLTFLTSEKMENNEEISRETRIRSFMHVFLGCPRVSGTAHSEMLEMHEDFEIDEDTSAKFSLFVHKMNACVNHLEQLPIKTHELNRSAGSTLRFFKTHHLKCSLQRHPQCNNLKSWKGGLVKIDPLALVQAIERYLLSKGYGDVNHSDNRSDSGGSDEDELSDNNNDEMMSSNNNASAASSSGSRARSFFNSGPSSGSNSGHRLEFYIGEHKLPYDMTVYQAVQQYGTMQQMETTSEDNSDANDYSSSIYHSNSPGIWARIHTIYYKSQALAEGINASSSPSFTSSARSNKGGDMRKGKGGNSKQSKRKAPDDLWNEGQIPVRKNPLDAFLDMTIPASSSNLAADPSFEVLRLLRILHALNRYWGSFYPITQYRPIIQSSDFINSKLSAKINRQLQDPIIIMTFNLPPWLKEVASQCPFMFPFETRQLLFYVTSFDRDRALLRLLDSVPELASDGNQERVVPDLDKKKRMISRNNLLQQAEQVVNEVATSRSLLEIQYENEVGTGLGPTLEFYTLVSKELQRADLGLWKGDTVKIMNEDQSEDKDDQTDDDDEDCIEYVHSAQGLYPTPLARNAKSSVKSRVRSKFVFVGKFIAKAVLDNRMIDIPFSLPFFHWLLRDELFLATRDLSSIDPTIATTVSQLEGIVRKKRRLELDEKISAQERNDQIKNLTMDGCPIEELGLDFTLPGYPNIELRKNGKDLSVTLDNLNQYVQLVSHWMLLEGVSTQMEALREGFDSVFPLDTLRMFFPEELDLIFCGSEQATYTKWDKESLLSAIKPDHGYTRDSQALHFLTEVMASYNRDEQRQFLQFVTGSPRLPVGGFRALSPPLTVVKKSVDEPDNYLPSVMTCVNYLKLPDYSNQAALRSKMAMAFQEGQYAFHLS